MGIDPEKLIRAREKAGLTRAELARAAGLSARALQYLEGGGRGSNPHYETVTRLTQALGLKDHSELMRGSNG